jgi:predicted Fe-Mo cluster-binding NifX family protein
MTSISFRSTILIIPPNDAEGILISQIAEKIGLPILVSKQTHGASLDKGRDYFPIIRKGGYKNVIVVEMPGPKVEARLKKAGIKLVIIDHHHYTGLDRAHSASGKMLPSSLEQFVKMFRLTDAKLGALGFEPLLIRGIGILDRGFIWALQEEKFSKNEIERILNYHDSLLSQLQNPKTEMRKQALVRGAWEKRKKWKSYFIVEINADIQLRPRLSRIVAEKFGKPTSLIIIERKRGLIYVQESDKAMDLFQKFGGFTFGQDRNWGYRNEKRKPHVTLRDIKAIV